MGVQLNEDKTWHLAITNSFASVAANTTAEQTVTVPGLRPGDSVMSVNKATAQAGLGVVGKRVAGANSLAVTFSNNTGSPIVPTANDTYSVTVFRPEKTYPSVPA